MAGTSGTWNYTYDEEGLRTQRTDGTTTYNYVYADGLLRSMTVTENNTTNYYLFRYSPDGQPYSVRVNTTEYFYLVNLQGDVIGIRDKNGTTVVSYTYDAWGNILSTTGTMASTLGVHNPLRYRGYVYDQETGLYYLQSRYYNPTWGRFLNADGYAATGQGMLGNNMFAYCGNDPINFADSAGTRRVAVRDFGGNTSTLKNEEDMPWFEKMLLHMARPRKEGNTFSAGITGGYSYPTGTAGESYVLSADTSHNYAFQKSTSLGASSGLGGSAGIVMMYTNATDVQDLTGMSNAYGGTLVSGYGISIDYVTFTPKSNPNTTCWGISIVISLGGEAEIHSTENYTTSTNSWNPFDALREAIYG